MTTIHELAKERFIMNIKEKGNSYKKLSKEQLIKEIREELADTINYIKFIENNENIELSELRQSVQKLDEEIVGALK